MSGSWAANDPLAVYRMLGSAALRCGSGTVGQEWLRARALTRSLLVLPVGPHPVKLPELQEVFEILLGHRLTISVGHPELGPLLLREVQDGIGVGRHLPRASRVPAHPIRDAPLADVALRAGAAHLEPAPPALCGEGALVVAPGLQEPVEYVPEVRVILVRQTRLPSVRFSATEHIRAAVFAQGLETLRAAFGQQDVGILPNYSVICVLGVPK